MKIKTFFYPLFLLALITPLSSCSTNPATGRTQFAALMSPEQEGQVGAEEHPNIIKEFGEYNNPAVKAYVEEVGRKVTQNTERPDVQYKFFVVDSPIINAFALPGGYIYISRGLLAVANSEAELASVLGHEAGHITGRHSAERYSRGVVTSLGASILAAAIDKTGVSQALGLGSDLYLKSYSRAQESEADTLGIRYLAQNGYEPSAMTSFLSNLQNASAFEAQLDGRQQSDMSYFSTHPATGERVAKTAGEVAQVQGGGAVNRDRYLDVVNGITYGDSPSHGFIRKDEFIHPGLGFKFNVPQGFKMNNQPTQVVAVSEQGAAMIFDLAKTAAGQDPLGYLTQVWLKGEAASTPENITVNGMRAATVAFPGSINNVPMTIRLLAIEFASGQMARFQIGIPNNAPASLVDGLKRASYSFAKISAGEKASYKPHVVRVVTAGAGDSVESLAARFPFDQYNAERFRMMNAIRPGEQVRAGQRYKIVVEQ